MWSRLADWRWPLLVGLVGWLAVIATRSDPGVTSDEPFNVWFGKRFVTEFLDRGWHFFEAESLDKVFADRQEAHQHPPLGRWLIGWIVWVQDPKAKNRAGLDYFDILDARVAPATAFAITLMLLTRTAARSGGTAAGMAAGISLLLMPRVFAHAHFAALDTMVSWTYLMGILSATWMMEGPRPWLRALVAGLLLGCALLTKLHGLFLLPVVAAWAITCYGWRGLGPVGLWSLVGVAVFFVGWPWLWSDVLTFWNQVRAGRLFVVGWDHLLPGIFPRLTTFLGSSLDRQEIHVWYLGEVYRDSEIPWHYPWILFAITVPLGLHLMGLVGAWRQLRNGWSNARGCMFGAAVLFPLAVFSVPGIPVYDGVRLFLMVFPIWAWFVGKGAGTIFEWLRVRWQPRGAALALTGFFACQTIGLIHYHPFQLSYYNLLTSEAVRHPGQCLEQPPRWSAYQLLLSGLRGAERLGFEVTYWGDAITPKLVDRWSELAPEGACAVLVPTLYDGQVLLYDTEGTIRKKQKIRAALQSNCSYLLVYNRRAYLGEVSQVIDDPNRTPLAQNSVDGVVLGAVYARQPSRSPAKPEIPQALPNEQ